jgi:hypothetical protein
MYQVGSIVYFSGVKWEIEAFETDHEGFLAVSLIDPNFSNAALERGETAARILVRDLNSIK